MTACILLVLFTFSAACKMPPANMSMQVDTTILAASAKPITISGDEPVCDLRLDIIKGSRYNSAASFLLFLDKPSMPRPPEGIYEVYVSPRRLSKRELHPESPYFVSVLDTYSLTSGDEPTSLTLDLHSSRGILSQYLARSSFFIVTILFRGNTIPGNGMAKDAGKISFQGVRIGQLKNN